MRLLTILFLLFISVAYSSELEIKKVCLKQIKDIEKFTNEKVLNKKFDISICYPKIKNNGKWVNGYLHSLAKELSKDNIKYLNSSYKDLLQLSKEEREFIPYLNGLSFYLDYKIGLSSKNIFSGYFEAYTYAGGAHGGYNYVYLTLDLKNKKELKFYDIFKKNKEKSLRKLIIVLYPRADIYPKRDFLNDKSPLNFYLYKNGVVFTLEPYEYGPYASGFREFKIPYKYVKPYIKENSPVFEFFENTSY